MDERITITKQWTIRRYADDHAFAAGTPTPVVDAAGQVLPAESIIDGNLLLNEGIQLLLDLLIGGAGTAYTNAASYLGVGDSSTAEDATQTGLQAAVNKTFRSMEATYPKRTNQTMTWRAVFDGNTGNHAWNEFTVSNSNSDAGVNLNRKVSAQGTKTAGQTWTLDLAITVS